MSNSSFEYQTERERETVGWLAWGGGVWCGLYCGMVQCSRVGLGVEIPGYSSRITIKKNKEIRCCVDRVVASSIHS